MGKGTGIAWADDTFNPWRGCVKVSPGCDHCYAETLDSRFDAGGHWGADAPRKFFGEKHWAEPLSWNREAAREAEIWLLTKGAAGSPRRLVFCASTADVFEARPDLEPWRLKLWGLIKATRHLTWLLLTKRPQNIGRMLPEELVGAPNVWLGTTVESNAYRWRVTKLLEHGASAAVRFLSMEPLLDYVNLAGCPGAQSDDEDVRINALDGTWSLSPRDDEPQPVGAKLDWIIAGCESGDGARDADTRWFRFLRAQCADAGVPFFLKQAADGAEGIGLGGGGEPADSAPFRKRDLRTGDDGIKRARFLIERPYLDGVQHLGKPPLGGAIR